MGTAVTDVRDDTTTTAEERAKVYQLVSAGQKSAILRVLDREIRDHLRTLSQRGYRRRGEMGAMHTHAPEILPGRSRSMMLDRPR
jgi:hypothetical protein